MLNSLIMYLSRGNDTHNSVVTSIHLFDFSVLFSVPLLLWILKRPIFQLGSLVLSPRGRALKHTKLKQRNIKMNAL